MSLLKMESLIDILQAYDYTIITGNIGTTLPELIFNSSISKAEAIPPRIGIASRKQNSEIGKNNL